MAKKTETGNEKSAETLQLELPRQETGIIPLDDIDADDAFNCRIHIDETCEKFKQFVQSIATSGLKEPIVVTPSTTPGKYKLVAGFRRVRALRHLGVVATLSVIEHYENPIQAMVANLIENNHRERLRPYEVALACWKLRKQGYSNKSVAKLVSMTEPWVSGLNSCIENLIPPLLEIFSRRDDEATVTELVAASRLPKDEQQDIYDAIRGRKSNSDSGEKPEKEKDTRPRMLKRDAVRAALGDLKRTEAIMVRGEPIVIDDDSLSAVETVMRWVIGELKTCPLVLAPDDKESA